MAARKSQCITVNSDAQPTSWGAHTNLRQTGAPEPRTQTLEPRDLTPAPVTLLQDLAAGGKTLHLAFLNELVKEQQKKQQEKTKMCV